MLSKAQTAQSLATAHFRLDYGITRIFRLLGPNESQASDPVKLLEINSMTPEAGILPVALGPSVAHGIHYPTVVIEITPGEFDLLGKGVLDASQWMGGGRGTSTRPRVDWCGVVNWSQAFVRQAASDMDVHQLLATASSIPESHSLHYLQMACEKLCKAAMIAAGNDPLDIQRSHAHIAKQLPIIVKLYMSREAGRLPRENWIVAAIRPLARKIELLNPAVQDGGRSPQNSEYPWTAPDGSIIAPADHKFEFNALFERAGVTLLKIMRRVALDLQR